MNLVRLGIARCDVLHFPCIYVPTFAEKSTSVSGCRAANAKCLREEIGFVHFASCCLIRDANHVTFFHSRTGWGVEKAIFVLSLEIRKKMQ